MDLFWGMKTPGPGVAPDEPRKKGLRRFWELLLRDGKSYLLANLICLLAFTPAVVLVGFGVAGGSMAFAAGSGALLGIPTGIALCGVYDTVLRTLRDEAGFWWHTYRRALVQNLRLAVPLGALFGATVAMIVFTLYWQLRTDPQGGALGWLGPAGYGALACLLFASMLPQAVLLDVSFVQLLKNSLFFVMGRLPRVAAAAAVSLAYWAATVAWFPYSTLFLPLLGFWFTALLGCMLVWPALDEIYQVEKTLQQRRQQAPESPETPEPPC